MERVALGSACLGNRRSGEPSALLLPRPDNIRLILSTYVL